MGGLVGQIKSRLSCTNARQAVFVVTNLEFGSNLIDLAHIVGA